MTSWVIGTPEFQKRLDSWLFKSDQPSADFLFRNKSKIPPLFQTYNEKLYRGMIADRDFINEIETRGLTFKTHTSWSKDLKTARKFATDPAYVMGNRKEGEVIIIEKIIPRSYQILDIDAFVSFMGMTQLSMMGYDETNLDSAMKEKEVLVSKGIRIIKKDIKIG